MHQLHTAVNDLDEDQPPHQHSHGSNRPVQPPVPAIVHPSARISSLLARTTPLPSYTAPLLSRLGTPANLSNRLRTPVPTRPTPRSNTRDLVAQARSQARSPSLVIPRPVSTPSGDLLRLPPLRKSLQLPSFMGGEDYGNALPNEELPQPSSPIMLDDTDIQRSESALRPVTQAQRRAAHYLNVRVLPRHSTLCSMRVPTVQQLQLNKLKVFKLHRRRNRNRSITATDSARSRNILSSGQLSDDQRTVVSQTEFHVLKDILCVNPWPELDAREDYLLRAQQYATGLTGVSGDNVFSQRFLNTVSTLKHFFLYRFLLFIYLDILQDVRQPRQLACKDIVHG